MSKILKILVGLILSAIFIYFSFRQINLGDVRARGLQFSFVWLLSAVLLYSAGVVLRGIRWRMILASSTAISTRNSPTLTVLGTILLEKILDTLVLVGLAAIALSVLNQEGSTFLIVGAIVLLTLGANLLFVLVNGSISRRLLKLLFFLPDRINSIVSGVISRVQSGFGTIESNRIWIKVVLISALIWILESISYLCVGASIGIFLNITHFTIVTSASNLAIAVPSTSGGIGPFEFFAKESLTFVSDISVIDAAVYAVVLHFLLLAPVSLVGLFLAWIRGLSILKITRQDGEAMRTK